MYFIGTVTGASGASSAIAVPRGARFIYANAGTTGLGIQLGMSTGPTGAFIPNGAQTVPLPLGISSVLLRTPRLEPPGQVMVAVYNPNGGNVAVSIFGAPPQ